MNAATSVDSTPASPSSSRRRSSVVSRSTLFPSAIRGCGSKVMTVGASPVLARCREHGPVPAVDAVEAPDRDRPRRALELVG